MRDSIVVFTKYEEQINLLSDAQAGILFRAIIRYQSGAELPVMDEVTAMAFSFIRQKIDEENQKRDELSLTNKNNGKLGGRPSKSLINKGDKPKKPNGFESSEEKPNGFENNRTVSEKTERFSKETTFPDKESSKEINPFVQEITPLFISPQKGEKKTTFADDFFAKYPRYAKDRDKMRLDVKYDRLIDEFGKSQYLRNLYTVKQINELYPLIIQGDFRDKPTKPDMLAGIEAKAERERWYEGRRRDAESKAESVLERFLQDDEFRRIHKRLRTIELDLAKAEVDADTKKMTKYTQEKARLTLQYRGIIERNGMTEEDLMPKWHCGKCQDTGYMQDGKMCDCYEGGR